MGLVIQIILFIFVSCSVVGVSKCELEAILTNSRFPVSTFHIRSIYDGDDFIYIFGGLTPLGDTNRIHRYEISSDTLSPPIALFPNGRHAGAMSSDSSGNIFYFGGPFRTVTKFDPTNLNSSHVATLEANFALGSAVTHPDSPDIVYLIGGGRNTVQCFNMSSASSCGRFDIPTNAACPNAAFVQGEKAFVFGRVTNGDILLLDLESLQFEIVPAELPAFAYEPSVVTDGRYAYLIGGSINSSQTPTNSLVRFDPQTLEVELIHVKNHPGLENKQYFHFTSTLFVEKLNRIYVFGGLSRTTIDHFHDEIWYIDLTYSIPTTTTMKTTTTVPTTTISTTTTPPTTTTSTEATTTDSTSSIPTTTELNPDIFNCEGKPNGMYPHPSDCVSYIGCYDGTMSLYECPPPLLFHPERERCDFPQEFDCLISCLGRPDGLYPHPHHCHLFIGCLGGSLRVHKCPDDLLFDPQLFYCWYPEEVECLTE